jgi:hypothetical protein
MKASCLQLDTAHIVLLVTLAAHIAGETCNGNQTP